MKRILTFLRGGAVALFIISLINILLIVKNYRTADRYYTNLRQYEVQDSASFSSIETEEDLADIEVEHTFAVEHDALLAGNPDYVGWIEIPGTAISFPVVQAEDNDFYLRRSFDRTELLAGSIFMDYRCDADFSGFNTVVYGHHLPDGSMFSSLERYMDESYSREHSVIRVHTPTGVRKYHVFSVYKADAGSDALNAGKSSDRRRPEWLHNAREFSLFDFGIPVSASDNILTLITCTGGELEMRYVVQAVLMDSANAFVENRT